MAWRHLSIISDYVCDSVHARSLRRLNYAVVRDDVAQPECEREEIAALGVRFRFEGFSSIMRGEGK